VEMFPFVLAKKTAQAQGAVFGKILQRHVDAPVGQWRVRQRKARQTLYRLEAIHES